MKNWSIRKGLCCTIDYSKKMVMCTKNKLEKVRLSAVVLSIPRDSRYWKQRVSILLSAGPWFDKVFLAAASTIVLCLVSSRMRTFHRHVNDVKRLWIELNSNLSSCWFTQSGNIKELQASFVAHVLKVNSHCEKVKTWLSQFSRFSIEDVTEHNWKQISKSGSSTQKCNSSSWM